MTVRLRLDPRLFLGLIALAFLAWMVPKGLTPLYDPDSTSYLDNSSFRSLGYPMILRLFGMPLTVLAQPVVYAAAVLVLCFEMLRRPGMGFWSVVTAAALLGNPELNKYHAYIMTESLFFSLTVLWLAAALRYLRKPSAGAAVALSLLAGLAAIIRPTAYMMPALLVLLVLLTHARLKRGELLRMLALAVLPMLLLVGVERGVWRSVHGPDAVTLAGRHFFAKGGLIDSPSDDALQFPDDPVRQRLQEALRNDFAPVRQLLREVPEANILDVLQGNYEICMEYACSEVFRKDLPQVEDRQMNKLLIEMGLRRIASSPMGYLRLTLRNYLYMWELYSQSHPDLLPGFEAYIATKRPLPFEEQVQSLVTPAQPSRIAIVVRPGVMALGWLTGLLSLAGLVLCLTGRVRSELLGGAIASGVLCHVGIWFTAMLGIGCPRYTVSFWPAMVFSGICFSAWGWQRLRGRG